MITSESILNQNTIRIYIDGLKLKQAFFHLGIDSTVFQAEVSTISEEPKNLRLEEMHNRTIVVLSVF